MTEINLFTPGPTHIPQSVLTAMARSEDHHRTKEFAAIFLETAANLQETFNSPYSPIFLACSGSGAMEAVISSGLDDQSVLGFLSAGKFGERWGEIANALSFNSKELLLPWGESPTVDHVIKFLDNHPTITHFAMQYCETSTTVLHDAINIAKAIKAKFPNIIFILDAISAATTLPIDLAKDPIDALVLASQKAYMLPPGLAMVFLSDRYKEKAAKVKPRSLYFDLLNESTQQKSGYSAWTPAISLIFGLRAALKILNDEGLNNVYERHKACRDLSLERFQKLGFKTIDRPQASTSVTAGFPADGLDPEKVKEKLQNEFGIQVAGGQDLWKGKMLRVGHMGIITPKDIDRCFNSLEKCL